MNNKSFWSVNIGKTEIFVKSNFVVYSNKRITLLKLIIQI